MQSVSVIIPTTCESARGASLARAVDSILMQENVAARLIVVANGNRVDPQVMASLEADPRISVAYRPTPSAPLACEYGRTLVATEFFAYLDDDDEYLPDSLALRCAPLAADPSLDFVVTNGFRGAGADVHIKRPDLIHLDPLSALLQKNWLASCGAMYRARSCEPRLFEALPTYMEWTMLAYRLLLAGKKLHFLDVPTYRINDTPGSLSKSMAYRETTVMVLEQLIALPLPPGNRRVLRQRLLDAHHDLSVSHIAAGNKKAAWRHHLLSLSGRSGWRYVSYTRRLLS